MRALLDGLLEYSRVQARPLNQESVGLNRPVQHAIDNLTVLIQEKGAQILVGELPEVIGDEVQMTQLFQNLISNGIKFCQADRPTIRISARQLEGRWVVDVADNGIGIDPAHHSRIFQIFQRVNGRSEYPGTGVGLSVCNRIMLRLNGCIGLDSALGKGSTFHLYF
jgi:light-regulated signal transduction histidine kinase (bacteriophytochrome)